MNDAEGSSAAAAAAYDAPEDGQPPPPEPAPTTAELAERKKKNRKMFNKKRGELLEDLCRNLDILIYAELSTVYYMDCSFFRFLLRALIQFMFLTPKPPVFPEHPADKPVIVALLGSNFFCFLLHSIFSPPSAGEATRGYLHGGVAMDFIGQKGPSSKMHLLLLDALVIALQLVHLAANMVRKKIRDASASPVSSPAQSTTRSNTTQDLDSEERGVRRSDEQQDIEMQTLNPSGSVASAGTNTAEADGATDETSERESLLALTTAPRTDAHIFDAFNSGQIVLADLDLWQQIQEQVKLVKSARHESSRTTSQSLRAELAARMLRMRIGTDTLRQTL